MIGAALKFIFAGGIIYWLVSSGKLDLTLISRSIKSGPEIYIGILIYIAVVVMTSFRWQLLLQQKAKSKLSLKKILPINWIGLFFSTFLPGVVTGDVIKLVYIKDLDKNFSKTFLVTSVLVDRVIGLCGLLALAGIFTVFNYSKIASLSPEIKAILNFNFLFSLGGIAFIIALFLPSGIQLRFLRLAKKLPIIGNKVENTLKQTWLLGKDKKVMFLSFLISLTVQFLNVFTIWLITRPFYPTDIPLSLLFSIVPIGLISVAIPISPAGAGVGHFLFEKLFSLLGVSNGASLFNLHFLMILIVNILGVIPFLLKKKHSLKEAQEFEVTSEPKSI